MKLSIIVPVYNMAADGKLEYCLNSLVNQTIDDYEIIAVDDCSTDNSLEILRSYETKYSEKFKVIALPENHHQGGAKNFGLKEAKGDYIGFIDSDDWIVPDYYERLIGLSEKTGADCVSCDLCLVSEHTMIPTEISPCNNIDQTGVMGHEQRAKLFLDPGALVTKVYKRELLFEEPFEFPDKMFYEDNAMGIELLRRVKHFEHINEPLYFYLQHSGSTVHIVSKERCMDRLRAMRIMLSLSKENGYYEEFKPELEWIFTCLFYRNTLFSYMQGKQKKELSFIKAIGKEMKETFPDFAQNEYYLQRVDAEENKLMGMQQKSTLFFFLYYKALYAYRRIRKKIGI